MAKILQASNKGDLNGNFEDVLNYLSWTINARANKNFNSQQKGEEFFKAVKTLNEKFGVAVSTHFLKSLSELEQGKMLHILYMLRIGGFMDSEKNPITQKSMYMLNPSKVAFKGCVNMIDGTRAISPKVFDFLVFPNDWEQQKSRAEAFKQKCLSDWEQHRQMIAREQIEADKLKMVSTLEEKPIDFQELEDVSPHLIKKDISLMPKARRTQGYH